MVCCNLIDGSCEVLGFELGRRPESNQLAAVNEADAIAVLCLLHVVGGDKDVTPPSASVYMRSQKLRLGPRVYAGGGFIQKDDGG